MQYENGHHNINLSFTGGMQNSSDILYDLSYVRYVRMTLHLFKPNEIHIHFRLKKCSLLRNICSSLTGIHYGLLAVSV